MNGRFWFLVIGDWCPALASRARRCAAPTHVHTTPLTSHRRSRRGIALFDVIIGAMMLGAGLAVIISLSTRSLAAQTEGEKRMVAAWLADELLSMVIVEGPDEYSTRYDMEGIFYEPFEEFSYRVDIKDNGPGLAYAVVAHVGWEIGNGRTNEIEIEAAIAQRQGDSDHPREPRERIDREDRHYERIFGNEDGEHISKAPVRQPTNRATTGSGGANSGGRDSAEGDTQGGARGGARGGR